MPFTVPLRLLEHCTPRIWETLKNDARRRERLKPGAGKELISQEDCTHPGNLLEHLQKRLETVDFGATHTSCS